MVTPKYAKEAVTITAPGFQGFEPMTQKLAQKYLTNVEDENGVRFTSALAGDAEALADLQIAKFENVSMKDYTDEDAGDGQPLTYQKASTSKDVLIAKTSHVGNLVTAIRNNTDTVVETIKANGANIYA